MIDRANSGLATPAGDLAPDAMPIDHQSVDWGQVSRAVFQVRVHYRYTYSSPVTDLRQRLIVIPPDRHGQQVLLGHSLQLRGGRGDQATHWDQDDFGNRVCRLMVAGVKDAIDFEAHYRLERGGSAGAPAKPDWRFDGQMAPFLRPTALTAPDERLRQVADDIARASSSIEARAWRAHEWASSAITHRFGVTDVQTPAAMALYLGQGVCQDYAHILIAVLRLMAIPARYVSGHLPGDGAPHAWVEALVDEAAVSGGPRVLALDPSHRRATDSRYLTVAVGRDYADVSPTSGVFSGVAAGRLSSSKQARLVALTGGSAAEYVA